VARAPGQFQLVQQAHDGAVFGQKSMLAHGGAERFQFRGGRLRSEIDSHQQSPV
jgi:hypothetical protein